MFLLIAAGFAAWAWFRPYSWEVDDKAECKVVGVQLRADHDYYWVEPHLRLDPNGRLDLAKDIRLVTSDGTEFEAADTTFAAGPDGVPSDIWLKFWVRNEDLQGGLDLKVNNGTLIIKSSRRTPKLGAVGLEYYTSPKW